MSSGPFHRATAGIATAAGIALLSEKTDARDLPHPIAGGALATLFTNLPDLLEPATSPHHRQFFHSLAFASGIAYGLKKAYDWQPKDEAEKLLRHLALIAGGAYLMHLALDATTRRSLPLFGKL